MDTGQVWKNNNFIITKESVERFNKLFESKMEARYKLDERVLCEQIKNLIKADSTLEDIYIVVTLINSFYSTRMGADLCYKYAKILQENHNDIWVCLNNRDGNEENDFDTVQAILDKCKKELPIIAFSFISKYFSILSRYLVKEDRFPIYDNVVARMLCYNNKDNYKKIHQSFNDKNYNDYANIVSKLCRAEKIKYKAIDDYLWNLGRKIEAKLTEYKRAKIKEEQSIKDNERIKCPPVVISGNINFETMEKAITDVIKNM